ncbi:rab effector MyRIP isoform X2 [Hoplias malabaricus]|uniref:rab effector MyRIP isoform X2 n=1 Tax=Hoplias malabaricus TaxID=27720 RepID=UPI003462B3C3
MGRKLDLSSLTEEEAEHVLQVVQRDMRLRKNEEERLSDLKQELDEEDSRCVLLSRQRDFNHRCCIRCCSSFTFLVKPRRRCQDCHYNVCKRCCSYSSSDKGWICSSCEKSRLLKTQSLEWFYSNVRRRFKRFGSAKVLKTLYRRHIEEQGNLTELTEGSTYDESLGNEDSVYESDSTFYKHGEEHSMAETIGVALRVAEEAIDEAIAKAESHGDNQEKLKEARYLRDNRGELIEELTTTIVQKVIRRKADQTEMQPEGTVNWPPAQKSDVNPPACPTSRPRSALASHTSPKISLWRSRSALSLRSDEPQSQHGKAQQKPMFCKDCSQGLKKDGFSLSTLPTWKSVDRLDNSMLKSSDGNWIALQSTQLSRPSLLTKRKSLMLSALEKESGVVSAYDGMGSDTEPDPDGNWSAATLEMRHKLSSNNLPNDFQASCPQPNLKTPTQTTDQTQTGNDQDARVPKSHKSPFPFLKRKVPVEHRRSSSQRLSVMDINFNPEGTESSEDGLEDGMVKRTRRRRRNKQEDVEQEDFTDLYSAEPDYSRILLDVLVKRKNKREGASEILSDQTMDTTASDIQSSEAETPDAYVTDLEKNHVLNGSLEKELTSTLRELAYQVSATQLSSTEDELDRVEQTVGEGNDNVEDGREDPLWDIEGDAELEESEAMQNASEHFLEVKMNVDQKLKQVEEGQNCPENAIVKPMVEDVGKEDEVDGEVENPGTFTLDGDILQPINKQKESEMERTAGFPLCLYTNSKTTGEIEESKINIIYSSDSEVQTKSIDKLEGCTVEAVSEKVEGVEERRPECRHRNNSDLGQTKDQNTEDKNPQESQSLFGTEEQRQVARERSEEIESCRQVSGHKAEEQMKEAECIAKDEDVSVNRRILKDYCGCDDQGLVHLKSEEFEVKYKVMFDGTVKMFTNLEEVEDHSNMLRLSPSNDPANSEEEEETMAEEKEKLLDEEVEYEVKHDEEGMSTSKLPQETFLEKEDNLNLAEKKKEHTSVVKPEVCKENIIKEDVESSIYSQEVYLTPEEIYKGVNNLNLEKDLQFLSTLLQKVILAETFLLCPVAFSCPCAHLIQCVSEFTWFVVVLVSSWSQF